MRLEALYEEELQRRSSGTNHSCNKSKEKASDKKSQA